PPSANPSFSVTYNGSTDHTAPTANVTSPATGAIVSGTAPVSASASDNASVSSVDLYVDGTLMATTTTAPYTFNWSTTGVANGSHWLYALAHDAAGNFGTAGTIVLNVANGTGGDTAPPSAPSNLTASMGNSVDLSWA